MAILKLRWVGCGIYILWTKWAGNASKCHAMPQMPTPKLPCVFPPGHRTRPGVGDATRVSTSSQAQPADRAKPAFSNVPCTGPSHWSIRNIQPITGSGTTQASTARASQFILGHWVSKTKWCLMFCWCTAIVDETRRKYQVLECFAWFILANSVLSYLALHKECFKQVVSGFLLNNSRIAPFEIEVRNLKTKL